MFRWACERAGFEPGVLAERFPRLDAWERGEAQPTLKQLESFAQATHTPVGYLFLLEPPVEKVPIPDFRTMGNERLGRPSADLLDTIYLCQQRQEWYRDFARTEGEDASPVRGLREPGERHRGDGQPACAAPSASTSRSAGGRRAGRRRSAASSDWRTISDVLVMVSGVVGSNNRRKLDPEEFRGFALADPLAPLVFVNGADTKAAQMFTLAHELAHIWLGQSALSDVAPVSSPSHATEIWCNQVAAELLVPLAVFRRGVPPEGDRYEPSWTGWLGASRSAPWSSCAECTMPAA